MPTQDSVKQIGWSEMRLGISWSTTPSSIYRRFSISQTTDGFIVCDHIEQALQHVQTRALARAWAGVRVGEQCVRHE